MASAHRTAASPSLPETIGSARPAMHSQKASACLRSGSAPSSTTSSSILISLV